jgi:nicotinamidase-related amidase
MQRKNQDPQGSVPDKSRVALLIIDLINDLEFDGGEALLEQGLRAAKNIAGLKRQTKAIRIPTIYVNDNFGKWRSDFKKLIEHCIGEEVRGKPIVERLLPEADDYFVLKPKHSGFYSTTLDVLLRYLGCRILIVTGIAGDNCVLFTASDAHMRDYRLVVPSDCVASESDRYNEQALDLIQRAFQGDTRPWTELDLEALVAWGPDEQVSSSKNSHDQH